MIMSQILKFLLMVIILLDKIGIDIDRGGIHIFVKSELCACLVSYSPITTCLEFLPLTFEFRICIAVFLQTSKF